MKPNETTVTRDIALLAIVSGGFVAIQHRWQFTGDPVTHDFELSLTLATAFVVTQAGGRFLGVLSPATAGGLPPVTPCLINKVPKVLTERKWFFRVPRDFFCPSPLRCPRSDQVIWLGRAVAHEFEVEIAMADQRETSTQILIDGELVESALRKATSLGWSETSPSPLIERVLREWIDAHSGAGIDLYKDLDHLRDLVARIQTRIGHLGIADKRRTQAQHSRDLRSSTGREVRSFANPPAQPDEGDLHPLEATALTYIRSLVGPDGVTSPIGYKAVAKAVETSPTGARKIVGRLVDEGYLVVVEPPIGSRGARYRFPA